MKQVPMGSDKLVCPLHKQTMDKVCHTCPWWYGARGTNKNTGEEVDEWQCAVALIPLLLVETADQTRQGVKATLDFRNEVVKQEQLRQLLDRVSPTPQLKEREDRH